jgi:hypothetical protein
MSPQTKTLIPVAKPLGLLLAMMEPPSSLEAEFQDWYDSEHFPERERTEGFLTARRFVCLDGWPRYLALYDLADAQVLDGPAYAAIARTRYSLWTQRIVPRVWGSYRAEAVQVFPGKALIGANGNSSRLALWRFRQAPETMRDPIFQAVSRHFEALPGLLQLRFFEAKQDNGNDYFALAEFGAPVDITLASAEGFGDMLRYLDLANVYTRYWR